MICWNDLLFNLLWWNNRTCPHTALSSDAFLKCHWKSVSHHSLDNEGIIVEKTPINFHLKKMQIYFDNHREYFMITDAWKRHRPGKNVIELHNWDCSFILFYVVFHLNPKHRRCTQQWLKYVWICLYGLFHLSWWPATKARPAVSIYSVGVLAACSLTSFSPLITSDVTLWGLEVGLLTMKKGELAHFLFKPKYAYGEMGCPPLIPSSATVFYEVHVIDFLDSAKVDEFFALAPVRNVVALSAIKRCKAVGNSIMIFFESFVLKCSSS